MAAASLFAFPYPYSVYPHLDRLNIGPHRRTTRTFATLDTIPGATDRMEGAGYRTPNP
jgi:hypothetical protein